MDWRIFYSSRESLLITRKRYRLIGADVHPCCLFESEGTKRSVRVVQVILAVRRGCSSSPLTRPIIHVLRSCLACIQTDG